MVKYELQYWAEGNTNQAARNVYKILLKNTRKLRRIKAIIKSHYDIYKKSNNEIVDWLDNTVIKPNGYRIDHQVNKNKEMLKIWDNDNKMISDKNHMVKASSFESIVMFLIQKDNRYLKKLEDEYIQIKNKIDQMKGIKQNGGSNTLQVVEDFLQINCENAGIVRRIIQSFDRILYKKVGTYDGKNIVEDIGYDIQDYFKDYKGYENIPEKLMYSSRTHIYDIWNITIFLLSLQSDELIKYYDKIRGDLRKRKEEKRKMNLVMKRLKKQHMLNKKST